MSQKIDIVFDGPPGVMPGRFVEVENTVTGKSVSLGEWIERADGYWVLRLTVSDGEPLHDPVGCPVCEVRRF